MSLSFRLAVVGACLLALPLATGCSEEAGGSGASCQSDLDCSRRDQCVDKVCVPIEDPDATTTSDTEVLEGDASPEDTQAQDVASDVSEADGDAAITTDVESNDTSDTADVVDPCIGLCDADELCDNGRCFCTPGRSRLCGSKIGTCRQGQSVCRNGQWDNCEGDTRPSPEICDLRDNNCNGFVDELVCEVPVVACPDAVAVPFGTEAQMTGEGSDPDGGDVTYEWTLIVEPDGTLVSEVIGDQATLTFSPPSPGTWRVELCVTDNERIEVCCETEVVAIPPCVVPPAPTLSACGISWDRRPIVQFQPLPVGVRYELSIEDQPWAAVTIAGQNYYRPPEALPGGGPPPSGTAITISGRACAGPGDTCCSTEEEVTVNLIESCTEPIAPTTANVIFSEYLINGKDATGVQGPNFEAGEAVELTNLSNCPVSLAGHHLRYCNNTGCTSAKRYQNFGVDDVIPPRGVFVTIRAPDASTCGFSFMPDRQNEGIFGIRSSTLELSVDGTTTNNSGWFNNNGGALRFASGPYAGPFSGTTILEIGSYNGTTLDCQSVGFDALGACGDLAAGLAPTGKLFPNQLGRLWHPCDAVVDAFPAGCF